MNTASRLGAVLRFTVALGWMGGACGGPTGTRPAETSGTEDEQPPPPRDARPAPAADVRPAEPGPVGRVEEALLDAGPAVAPDSSPTVDAGPGPTTMTMDAVGMPNAGVRGSLKFRQQTLRKEYQSEGIAFGDLDKDGQADVVSGPHWWKGPAFTVRHELYPAAPTRPNPFEGASNVYDWATYLTDANGDGWLDVIAGRPPYHAVGATLFENPGMPNVLNPSFRWSKRDLGRAGFEQRPFADVTGDGKPDLLCKSGPALGYYDAGRNHAFVQVAPGGPWPDDTTHGLGIGDVDGDGKMEILHATGYWTRGANGNWTKTDATFRARSGAASDGGAEIHVYDVDGDGDSDVVSSLDSHGWGLAWFEQVKQGNTTRFVEHKIMGSDAEKSRFGGIAFSQLHALVVHDVDGDGLEDIVTGKSYKAHRSGDPDTEGMPVIYVFRLTRTAEGVKFVPHLVNAEIGIGRQFTVGDVNADGTADILVATRKGVHLFLQEPL